MKKIITTFLAISFFGLADAQVKTPQPSVSAEIEQVVGMTKIEVEYSRPSKNGREIFGNLVPYGKIWRTGANKNTTIEFKDNVLIGGQQLKAGKYAIYTKPEKDSWEIYFYADNENWGNPEKWDDSKVALKTRNKVQTLAYTVESFTIGFEDLKFDSALLALSWDNVKVVYKVEVPTDDKVMKSIEETMKGKATAQDYMAAANYFYTADKDIQQAKKWMDEGMALNQKPAFYQIYQQALIYKKAGDKAGALNLAKKALDASKAANSSDYVKLTSDLISELSK